MLSPIVNAVRYNLEERHKKRRMRVFGVGCVKTGTHYLADVFSENYRSVHEPHSRFYQPLITRDRKFLLRCLIRLSDVAYRIDINSSHLNRYMIPSILGMYPDSRFILTYRECRSWLDSIINHMIFLPLATYWKEWAVVEFGTPPYDYPKQEQVLEDRQLPPLRVLLSYWERHNRFVLDHVPPSRLLVIELSDLSGSKGLLADFLNIEPASITEKREKSFPASGKANILGDLDKRHVDGQIEEVCGSVLERLGEARAVARPGPSASR